MNKLLLTTALISMSLGTAQATVFGSTDNSINNKATGVGVGIGKADASSSSTSNSGAVSSVVDKSTTMLTANPEQNLNIEAPDMGDMVPNVYAPSLTTGVCMGSVSGGGSGSGFGISFGSTVNDEECQLRMNSIRLQQLGMDKASVLIMCQVPSTKLALEQSGFYCPSIENDKKTSHAPTAPWVKR